MSTAGHIRRRGKASWEIKFDAGRDPATGKRTTRYLSFKGTKRDAEKEAARLIAAEASGAAVEPSKVTVSDFIDRWQRDWAALNVSPKTLERYTEILTRHVKSRLGATAIQKLRAAQLAELYSTLSREGGRKKGQGLSARTIGHVHRVLHRVLGHALRWGVVQQNVADLVSPPKVTAAEIQILKAEQIKTVLDHLSGNRLLPVAALALGTGMRRGEIAALRWGDVDLDGSKLRVERSLETTKTGLRFKAPKTKNGRRSITLPSAVVLALKSHWRAQQEQRLGLGLGRASADDLVFSGVDGEPIHPDSLTTEWRRAMKALKLSVTFHSLRHTHASQLIASGLDVLTISRRLGHGSPTITLAVYGHLFANTDDRAAAVAEAMFSAAPNGT